MLYVQISGFTAWASMQSPSNVFTFLETLYQLFDIRGKPFQIFKVETIGDCYMAVTGLPDKDENQVLNMIRFSCVMIEIFQSVQDMFCTDLDESVRRLNLRIGIHCGNVTAGVLRGTKSRFQLFGDTVNTAARFEQHGLPGKIHCSQQIFECLHSVECAHWCDERIGGINAKGKGVLKSFWIVPSMVDHSITSIDP